MSEGRAAGVPCPRCDGNGRISGTGCEACKVEARMGTEECPHPIDARIHTCQSAPTPPETPAAAAHCERGERGECEICYQQAVAKPPPPVGARGERCALCAGNGFYYTGGTHNVECERCSGTGVAGGGGEASP